jgi:hypothetical protein
MIARIAAAACFLFPAIAPASHGDSGHRGAGEIVPSAPAQDGPNVLRAYDISTLKEVRDEGRESTSLLPYMTLYQEHGDGWSEAESSFEADTIVSLVRNLFAAEFEYEGRRITSSPGGQLLIVGPEGLHARVASLLTFLDRTLNAQIEIAVDVIELPASSSVSLPTSSIITSAEARKLISAGKSAGGHEHFTMHVPTHRTVNVSMGQAMPMLVDYDVEIAQSATIADPIVATTSIGTQISLRAAPSPTGTQIAAIVNRGKPLGDVRNRTVHSSSPISVQDGVKYIDSAAVYQSVDVITASYAFDAHLDGQNAIVLQSELGLGRAGGTELVVLRQVGGRLPVYDSLEFDRSGTEFTILDMSFAAPPRTASSGTLMDPNHNLKRLEINRQRHGGGPMFSADIVGGYLDSYHEVLTAGASTTGFQMYGPHAFLSPYSSRGNNDAFTEEQRRIRDRVTSLQPETSMFDVTVTVVQSGGPDRPAVRTRMPVRSGTSCCAIVGIEGMELLDYDVEVAQGASVADASLYSVFDGLGIWLKPTISPSGNLVLEVRGAAHLQEGELQELPLQVQVMESVDQSTHNACFVNERVSIQTVEGQNSWQAVFGGTGGNDSVRIEVEVRRQ